MLRSAVGWAYAERILDLHPLDRMRGKPRPNVRMHAPADHVRAILGHAPQNVIEPRPGRVWRSTRRSGVAQGRADAATALVSRGDILQAKYRLRHRDAATTLRLCSHVLPLTDADASAILERLYDLD